MKAKPRAKLLVSLFGTLVALSVSPLLRASCEAPSPTSEQPTVVTNQALDLCRGLPKYDALLQSFVIDRAEVGDFDDNDYADALVVELRATGPSVFSSVEWSNPLRKNGVPRFDWGTFMKVYAEASVIVARHTWLTTWREASPGRSVELELHADHIGEDRFELETFTMPVWRDAGFRGYPTVSVLARRSGTTWAQLYLGASESRALVTEVSGQEKAPLHWLDGLPIFFHPNCSPDDESSHYAIVEPSGHWTLMTFSHCEP